MCDLNSGVVMREVNRLLQDSVEWFDAMSVYTNLNYQHSHHDINIMLTTLFHEGRFPHTLICVSRPIPGDTLGRCRRVYINTAVRKEMTTGKKAEERETVLKTALQQAYPHLPPAEATRRILEAILLINDPA